MGLNTHRKFHIFSGLAQLQIYLDTYIYTVYVWINFKLNTVQLFMIGTPVLL